MSSRCCVSVISGLNFSDLMVRQGVIDNPPKTPFTMGFELAGEVEALGEHTSKFEVGYRKVLLVTNSTSHVTHNMARFDLIRLMKQYDCSFCL